MPVFSLFPFLFFPRFFLGRLSLSPSSSLTSHGSHELVSPSFPFLFQHDLMLTLPHCYVHVKEYKECVYVLIGAAHIKMEWVPDGDHADDDDHDAEYFLLVLVRLNWVSAAEAEVVVVLSATRSGRNNTICVWWIFSHMAHLLTDTHSGLQNTTKKTKKSIRRRQ